MAEEDRPESTPEVPLQRQIIRGLESLVWRPGRGVSAFDQWEAVQLLGQLGDTAAGPALLRIMEDGTRQLRPPVGRWLRDTALETLLTPSALPRPAADRQLRRYYNLGRRLARGHLDRNLVYDDLPRLARNGRVGLVLRGYVLPLLALLAVVVVLAEVLAARSYTSPPTGALGAPILLAAAQFGFFAAAGLAVFNAHQALLVLLVALVDPVLRLPRIPSRAHKIFFAGVLGSMACGLAGYAYYLTQDMRALGYNPDEAQLLTILLALAPLLIVPCYMLAHDLERGAPDRVGRWAARLVAGGARAVRLAASLIYVVYLYAVLTLTFFTAPEVPGLPADLAIVLASWPALLYLVAVPVLVVLALALLARLVPTRRP